MVKQIGLFKAPMIRRGSVYQNHDRTTYRLVVDHGDATRATGPKSKPWVLWHEAYLYKGKPKARPHIDKRMGWHRPGHKPAFIGPRDAFMEWVGEMGAPADVRALLVAREVRMRAGSVLVGADGRFRRIFRLGDARRHRQGIWSQPWCLYDIGCVDSGRYLYIPPSSNCVEAITLPGRPPAYLCRQAGLFLWASRNATAREAEGMDPHWPEVRR